MLYHSLWKGIVALLVLGCSCPGVVGSAEITLPVEQGPMVVRDHPRLLLTPAMDARLQRVKPGSPSAYLQGLVVAAAERATQEPGPDRVLEGRRLLSVSRTYVGRLTCAALAWRLTRRPEFLAVVEADLQRVAGFSDWNPAQFLDVGEMTAAVALAYDWTWEALSPEVRQVAIDAIVRHGLTPFFTSSPAWSRQRNNWNPVCHGGLVLGALAVAESDPTATATVISRALRDVPNAFSGYGPDGAYEEGPTYWDYGTSYLILLSDALTSATGSAYGLDQAPGLLASGTYIAQVCGPSGGMFNYGDGMEKAGPFLVQAWFARRLGASWIAPDLLKISPQDRLLAPGLLWSLDGPAPGGEPSRSYLGMGANAIAVLRGTGTYVGIKGGSPSVNHGHQDVGSFVYESDAIRWSIDLGKEDYFQLEKVGLGIWEMGQTSDRWKVFRMSAASHAIPQIEGFAPVVAASADLKLEDPDGPSPLVTLDLSPLYAGAAARVVRNVEFRDRRVLRIMDAFTNLRGPGAVRWQMITRAEVTSTPEGLTLRQDGRSLMMTAVSSRPGRWVVEDVSRAGKSYERKNPGCSRLAWEVTPEAGDDLQIQVDLRPIALP